ncbi:MAG: hypothetical protein M0R46_11730 [Candidatus Muirbacterium halophilum]|nr:hypothetical protein [Candidatus Muirbacterium halophilum]
MRKIRIKHYETINVIRQKEALEIEIPDDLDLEDEDALEDYITMWYENEDNFDTICDLDWDGNDQWSDPTELGFHIETDDEDYGFIRV